MIRFVCILPVLLILTQTVYAETADATLHAVQSTLQDKQFAEAITQIDAALTTVHDQGDYLLYLKGRALFYNKDFTVVIEVCNRLFAAHPNSAWLWKASFLQA